MNNSLTSLPDDLPVPEDDGACDHLQGLSIPAVSLNDTDGQFVDLGQLAGRWAIFIYPMTGQPGHPLPDNWDEIPGASGCTPQSCSFRDHFTELQSLGVNVLGISTQTSEEQREAKERLHPPILQFS